MANEKIMELLKDESFVKELSTAATPEEAQKLFESKGGEITIEELKAIRAMARQQMGEKLDADELELVAGGGARGAEIGEKIGDALVEIVKFVGDIFSW